MTERLLLGVAQWAVAGPHWLLPNLEGSQVPRAALSSYRLAFHPTAHNVPCPHGPNKAIGKWWPQGMAVMPTTMPSVKTFSWAKTPNTKLEATTAL